MYQLLQAGHKSVKTVRTHAQAHSQGGQEGPHWGSTRRSPRPITQGQMEGGNKGPWSPKPWIKKLKLSCRITHIDVLAVAVMTIKSLHGAPR